MTSADATILGLARLLADVRLHVEVLAAENETLRAQLAEATKLAEDQAP